MSILDPYFSEDDCTIILDCLKHLPDMDMSDITISTMATFDRVIGFGGTGHKPCPFFSPVNKALILPTLRNASTSHPDVLVKEHYYRFVLLHELRHVHQYKTGVARLVDDVANTGRYIEYWKDDVIESPFNETGEMDFDKYVMLPKERDANGFAMSILSDVMNPDLKASLEKAYCDQNYQVLY